MDIMRKALQSFFTIALCMLYVDKNIVLMANTFLRNYIHVLYSRTV